MKSRSRNARAIAPRPYGCMVRAIGVDVVFFQMKGYGFIYLLLVNA